MRISTKNFRSVPEQRALVHILKNFPPFNKHTNTTRRLLLLHKTIGMASYIQGYDEERFVRKVNRNFICQICFIVVRDPVLCARNQHCFCRSCITRHLENAKRCPTCNDELTEQTLIEAPKMIQNIRNELKIRCVYTTRGCQETPELQHLEQHEDTCGFAPAVCTNQGCGTTVNKRDLIHHESEVCEFRKLKRHSCGEMSKTLEHMEKRIMNVDNKLANMKTKLIDIEKNMESKLEAVDNGVKELRISLVKSYEEMKDVLAETKEENTRKVRNTPSGDRENVVVAGGSTKFAESSNSVEMFNWRQKTWSPLQSMPNKRWGATSFVYNNHVTIAGGGDSEDTYWEDMIIMKAKPDPDLSTAWSGFPVNLPAKLTSHSSSVYKHQLIVTGGYDGNRKETSDHIVQIQLDPPYTMKTLSRMPEPRQCHCTEIFDDSLFIIGGRKTGNCKDYLSSVVLYDLKKNECKQLSPLPYEVIHMATVKWQDNIVVIGGTDKHRRILAKVFTYNVKTGQTEMLPPMKRGRLGCTAVVIQNNIVVMGGINQRGLKSVEAFNFETKAWQDLPEMSEERWLHTAVVI